MSTCFLARHVRSSTVGGSMEGPEVRTRLPINDAWLDSISDANLDEKKRPRDSRGGRRKKTKRKAEPRSGIGMHGPCAVNGKTSLHNGLRIKSY